MRGMLVPDPTAAPAIEPILLGPFLGHVTSESIKIWLHLERADAVIEVTVHAGAVDAPEVGCATFQLRPEKLFSDCVTMRGLQPDTLYYYKIWTNPAHSIPLFLDGLTDKELRFRTLSADPEAQIDFVVMSCHNPTVSQADGFQGHAVWADLPQIIGRESNRSVRFALMVGDQMYADDWEDQILHAESDDARARLYLSAYRRFWSNIHYRRVLCSLPAVMIWDDHDITDGWGSRVVSFDGKTSTFTPQWQRLFETAFTSFVSMQASRNPAPLAANPREGLDFAFRVGKWGFVFMDLRTNRNLRDRRLLTAEQAYRIRQWVEANQSEMHTLFVVSPVVFSHGSPVIEDFTVKIWPTVMKLVDWFARKTKWGQGLQASFGKSLGDITDDIKDSWGCKENATQADLVLDFLFGLQNDPEHPVGVVVLSGDIHTAGYANIYSSDPAHNVRSSIPHITSSPVSYAPFNWMLEAVYRNASKTVALGARGAYSSQISHHFCSRSVAVLSLRPTRSEGDYQLKVKYYLEGFPEPQILQFDLEKTSHRENVTWVAQDKLFAKEYAPTANIDVEKILLDRSKAAAEELNWKDSIVDLMKLLRLDSSLGARKQLAQQWGYTGTLNGSAEMNIWLHEQLVKKITESRGNVPTDV
jgi:hypothetical protein